MALINKIKAIADSIRAKTGSGGLMTLDEMPEIIGALRLEDETTAYVLVDETGYEIAAVLVDEPVDLTANATTDIRAGTTAITNEGIVTGEKEIPAYHVTEGMRKIPAGSSFLLKIRDGRYAYTRLQALFCVYDTTTAASVVTDRVVIENNVYPVNSADSIATVTLDDVNETIMFNIDNDSDNAYLLRYFTYKEEY